MSLLYQNYSQEIFFSPPIIIIDFFFFNFQIRFYIYLFEMSSRYF